MSLKKIINVKNVQINSKIAKLVQRQMKKVNFFVHPALMAHFT